MHRSMDNKAEIPEHFICPISLQIMKDPVTAVTGITYDRESIERWLLRSSNTVLCPVTKQPLPKDSDLTPNHTLLRLIKSWCTANNNSTAATLKSPTAAVIMSTSSLEKLAKSLRQPESQLQALQKLECLLAENEAVRKQVAENRGVAKAVLHFIMQCHRNNQSSAAGLSEALHISYLFIRGKYSFSVISMFQTETIISDVIDSLSWALERSIKCGDPEIMHTVYILKAVVQTAKPTHLKILKPEFFIRLVEYVRVRGERRGINAALEIMLNSSTWGRNRIMMVEAGAVHELIELEFNSPAKKTTELILGILFHLCECADGRAEFLSHAGGVAAVSRRILKLSTAADDRAVMILSMIVKFSGTSSGVLHELLRVGAVSKLCMVVQSDSVSRVKDKAMEMLRTHSSVWKGYPECVDLHTFTTDKLCRSS